MGEIKTTLNDASVKDFIATIDDETKRNDSTTLTKMFERVTGQKAKMWGTSIIGFGNYHYKSERSKQEGDWPLVGFSPRKQNLTLYILPGFENYDELLGKLGKHKVSKSCLYIAKLSNVDMDVLERLIQRAYEDMKNMHNQ